MTLFIDFKEKDQSIPKRELVQTSPVSLQIMSDPLKQKLKKFGETMEVDASIQFSDSHEGEKRQYNILTRIQTIQKQVATDETKDILTKL